MTLPIQIPHWWSQQSLRTNKTGTTQFARWKSHTDHMICPRTWEELGDSWWMVSGRHRTILHELRKRGKWSQSMARTAIVTGVRAWKVNTNTARIGTKQRTAKSMKKYSDHYGLSPTKPLSVPPRGQSSEWGKWWANGEMTCIEPAEKAWMDMLNQGEVDRNGMSSQKNIEF